MRRELKIGLVQPNFPYTINGEFSRDEALRQLTALQEQTRRLEHAGAQVVVWSEGSYPAALPRDFNADYPSDSMAMIRRGIDGARSSSAPIPYDSVHDDAFNSALLLDQQGAGRGALRQGAAAGVRRIHARASSTSRG